MLNQALGFIETYGYVGAIEAADSCLKAANVHLVNCHFLGKGLVTIIIQGDVSAVKAAIDAGVAASDRVGEVVGMNVIARPAIGLERVVKEKTCYLSSEGNFPSQLKNNGNTELANSTTEAEKDSNNKVTQHKHNKTLDERYVYYKGKKIPFNNIEIFKAMKVVDLRKIARQIKEISLTKEKIKYAKKNELIDALSQVLMEAD